MYRGTLVLEELTDLKVISYLEIEKTENNELGTQISFNSKYIDFPFILSECMKTFKDDGSHSLFYLEESNISFIVLKDNVLSFNKGNRQEKGQVIQRCLDIGINIEELKFID